MGKHRKKQKNPSLRTRCFLQEDEEEDSLPSSAYNLPSPTQDSQDQQVKEEGDEEYNKYVNTPSKFDLYQKLVQSSKGDISYLQKFFLIYVGGRMPFHLQEDFCSTALLSSKWLRGDPRRMVVGVDLDLEALHWCLKNNLTKIGA